MWPSHHVQATPATCCLKNENVQEFIIVINKEESLSLWLAVHVDAMIWRSTAEPTEIKLGVKFTSGFHVRFGHIKRGGVDQEPKSQAEHDQALPSHEWVTVTC